MSDEELKAILSELSDTVRDKDIAIDFALDQIKYCHNKAIAAYKSRLLATIFPEYATVTNPSYTFMVNKSELDAAIAAVHKAVEKTE